MTEADEGAHWLPRLGQCPLLADSGRRPGAAGLVLLMSGSDPKQTLAERCQ
jgi:hypothetical protein